MIYLDHAAAAPVFSEIENIWNERDLGFLGNPSSIHQVGQKAKQILDESRLLVSKVCKCHPTEVIFSSGGTESMHFAIIGAFLSRRERGISQERILISPLSHACVWGAVHFLQEHFGVTIEFIPLTKEGYFDWSKISSNDLSLYDVVVFEKGNSEIGTSHDLSDFHQLISQNLLESNPKQAPSPFVILDCSASVVSESINFAELGVDAIVLSGEKFGAEKGVGALIKRKDFYIRPLLSGSQEFGLRGGTENLKGIFSFANAINLFDKQRDSLVPKWKELHNYLTNFLEKELPNIKITTPEKSLSHILHFLNPTIPGNDFVIKADQQNICISAGAACSSGSVGGSRVLKNLGLSSDDAKKGIRISFGINTTKEEIIILSEFIKKASL